MQRFTISLDDALAQQFDELIAAKGYENRSEAVRDLIRTQLGDATLAARTAKWAVACVSYVYDHHEHTVADRVMSLQHDHHDLVITSLHTHLDHDHCLENVVLRGPTAAVQALAEQLVALRGVRHGNIHLVPLGEDAHGHRHPRSHDPATTTRHTHLKPLS
ncbi:nickel-responsive transcriptional regulator NikR [Variovorax terrae]|uniref:Putative nickel-responsive regulator n=1 Tax=Variovorax terrae TaxID=2923278 RepID=A0A9X2ARR7_9BURK|nr:nickel-responsive transcriptional regulator NikR [Variovorax terrae]MCJ0764481.1 nickel-responsive transcriptional regulator NikR [Variovorax terrae]